MVDLKYCFECPQELGFDYLRDNLAASSEELVMRWYVLRNNTEFVLIFNIGLLLKDFEK